MSEQFYSEYGEDQWIAENLAHMLPERGIYLDVGAAHPERNSNTAFLRNRGWVGLAVDGNEDYFPHWIGRQMFLTGLFAAAPAARFMKVPENSSISRVVNDPTIGDERSAVTLEYFLQNTFLRASPPITGIDFMSIDIEGLEFEVFNTFDWQRWLPRVIVAEYATLALNGVDVVEDLRLREMLTGSGLYTAVHKTVANIIYHRL